MDNLKADGGKIEFDRLDERSPFPIPDDARDALPLDPTILALSQYTLKIIGLPEGKYTLKINNVPAAVVSSKDLESGLNLTTLPRDAKSKEVTPIIAQSRAILAEVNAKENLVSQWRRPLSESHRRQRPG